MPAVSICTDSFRVPAQAMAEVYGLPDFQFVTVPHPIASLGAAEIEANVRRVIPEVLGILSGGEVADGPTAD